MDQFILQSVDDAYERIKTARERDVASQFLIGAGCSLSCGVPTAPQILKIIEKKYPVSFSKLALADQLDYRKMIDLLPTNERKELIIEITTNKKVSWGYLALARLMEAGYVSRVLSLNFDHQLQRACSFIGFHPAIYDFAAAPSDEPHKIVSPSIIHLHGQSYGFRQLSNERETNEHVRKLRPLIQDTFRCSPLFVAGYSGESDEVFKLLEKEYKGDEFLTWLGFDHAPKKHLSKLLSNRHAEFYGYVGFDAFAVALAIKLNCWPPRLVAQPVSVMQNWVDDLAKFQPSRDEESLRLQYATSKKLEQLEKDWDEKFHEIPDLENDFLSLNFKGIVSKYERSRFKKKIISSSYHREIVAWAYSELTYVLWNDCLRKKTPSQEREKNLLHALKYIDKALQIGLAGKFINQKINVYLLLYFVSRNAEYLTDAQNIFEKLNYRNINTKILYTAIIIYMEKYKLKNDKYCISKVNNIWKKLSKSNRNLNYNYICFLAISGKYDECKSELIHALEHGNAPIDKLKSDPDLDPIRNERWFGALRRKYKF